MHYEYNIIHKYHMHDTTTPSIPRDRAQIFFRNLVREEDAGLVSLPIFLN
jgi:hypothetical protein